jgi:hypothetical protein
LTQVTEASWHLYRISHNSQYSVAAVSGNVSSKCMQEVL